MMPNCVFPLLHDGSASGEEQLARWERFRWNQIGRLQEKLDALPGPNENDYARKLALRLERLRSL